MKFYFSLLKKNFFLITYLFVFIFAFLFSLHFFKKEKEKYILKKENSLILGVLDNNFNDEKGNIQSKIGLLLKNSQKNDEKIIPKKYQGYIRIAVLGDATIQSLGAGLPYLEKELKNYYPYAKIALFNYAKYQLNANEAYESLNKKYQYEERNYPSLTELKPDLIIINPFTYSPLEVKEDELYQHYTSLAKLTTEIKEKIQSRVIILTDPAPQSDKDNYKKINKAKKYLDNAYKIAANYKIPLVDIYHLTLLENNEGNDFYLAEDKITPNTAGKKLIAKELAKTIFQLNFYNND